MALVHSPSIVTSGLVLCLDAANRKSYPGSGDIWTDLINSNTASLDTPTYSNGTLNFSGIYDIVSSNYNLTLGGSFSISLWLKHTNSNPVKETYISLGFDKIIVRVNDAGNLNLYVTDATQQNLLTWGNNNNAQLGTNDGTQRNTPVTTFAGGTNWKQVFTGYTTVAIKTDGTLWTWGRNNSAQLGINGGGNRSTPVTTFAGGNDWKQVSGGGTHTAAIKTDGSLWTWGFGGYGQLGNFAAANRSTPVTTFAGETNWKQVSCGLEHTTAIKTDGSLWTWGRNDSQGRLGINNSTIFSTRSTPVTTFAGGNDWKQVSGGGTHTAAIKTDGSLWLWGGGDDGRLGTNDTTPNRLTPVTTFAGGNDWKQVSCGLNYTAAIKTDGSLWLWGGGGNGRLGTNDTTPNRLTPVTTFAGGTNWKSVACGEAHTAAIKTDGSLWVWGLNDAGQLGSGGNTTNIPVTVFGSGNNWKQVSITPGGTRNTAAIQSNETTTTDVSISTPILNTTYYNIVATSNGTTLKLYQNNSLLTTANLNGTLTSTTLFYTISDIMNSFAGNLANIQIHNKELTAAEVAQNFNALKSRRYINLPVLSIVTDGLVLYLDAGNTKSYPGSGTTWTDLSGNGNTGTLSATSIGYDSANGGSLVFDGTDDYVNLSFVNPFAETVIVWAKSATSNWNQTGWISSSRAQNGHIIHPTSGVRTLDYYIVDSFASFPTLIGSVTPDNITIPHMYAYTTNGSNLHKGYFDGIEVVSSSSSITRTTSPTAQNYYIGSDFTLNRYGNGNIYSCLRYNRALTATEIAQNYDALKGRYGLT